MLIIPLRWPSGYLDLVIVIEDENLARMRTGDPAEVRWRDLGELSSSIPRTIHIGYADPEQVKQIYAFAKEGKAEDAVKLISRGWQFRPDLGDHDFGPISLTKKGN